MNNRIKSIRPKDAKHRPGKPARIETRAYSNRSTPRVEMIDKLPPLITVTGGGNAFNCPEVQNELSGQYGIKLIEVNPVDYGSELLFSGLTLEQLPCDVDGDASPGSLFRAWGDRWGRGAAVVIGVDLPVGETPNGGPCDVPFVTPSFGFDSGTWDATVGGLDSNRHRILWRCEFPSGKLTDANVFKRVLTKSFGPMGARVGVGQVLTAWLVVDKQYVPDGATVAEGIWRGHVDLQLHISPTYSPQGFSESRP